MNKVTYTKRIGLSSSQYDYEILTVELECEEGQEKEKFLEARKIVGLSTTEYLTKQRQKEKEAAKHMRNIGETGL